MDQVIQIRGSVESNIRVQHQEVMAAEHYYNGANTPMVPRVKAAAGSKADHVISCFFLATWPVDTHEQNDQKC